MEGLHETTLVCKTLSALLSVHEAISVVCSFSFSFFFFLDYLSCSIPCNLLYLIPSENVSSRGPGIFDFLPTDCIRVVIRGKVNTLCLKRKGKIENTSEHFNLKALKN